MPLGILDVRGGQLSIYFGNSAETSDFIVDCLQTWWQQKQQLSTDIEELVIDLDNGIAQRSNRTQFIKRMVEFSHQIGKKIRLIYYPPYHSKYNPIERCWAVLENYWNGAILDSVEAAIEWAKNMTWKALSPTVDLVDKMYQKGVVVSAEELKVFRSFWQPSDILPKWDVTIFPP